MKDKRRRVIVVVVVVIIIGRRKDQLCNGINDSVQLRLTDGTLPLILLNTYINVFCHKLWSKQEHQYIH